MESADLQVLETLQQWVEENRRSYLVTLVKTLGSAPRSPGAILALTDQGDMVGSVSGGCVEDLLVDYLKEQSPSLPQRMNYGVDQHQALRYLLPCGGNIEIVIEPINSLSLIAELRSQIEKKQKVIRQLNLLTGEVTLMPAVNPVQAKVNINESLLEVVFGPRYRLLIIGANQIGLYLAQMAKALDYQVLVCDPREEIRRSWSLSDVPVDSSMPDDFIQGQKPDCNTAIVALTHDLKQDDLALMDALVSPAFYVGAVGSRKTQEARKARLETLSLKPEEIAKLKGPIGLSIGSKTPPEIALAILAQLTAIKNGVMH